MRACYTGRGKSMHAFMSMQKQEMTKDRCTLSSSLFTGFLKKLKKQNKTELQAVGFESINKAV